MKEKILAALKLKYTNLGFVDADFEGVANFLVATVTEDSQIETAVGGVEPLLKTFQSASDRKTTTLKAELDALKAKTEGVDPPKPEEKKEEAKPADAVTTKLLEAIESLKGDIATLKGGNVETVRKTALDALIKDVNPIIKDRILLNFEFAKGLDDAKYSEWVTKNTAGIEAEVKTLNEEKLSNMPKLDLLDGFGKDGKKSDFQTMMKETAAAKLEAQSKEKAGN